MLEHYFEMSHFDAERALDIYKMFTKDMDEVVEYLSLARRLESSTKLSVPNIKHAPTSLTQSLEDYLNDPEFEFNRRQFLAQKEAKLAAHRSDADVTPISQALIDGGFGPATPQPQQQPETISQSYLNGNEQQQQPSMLIDQNGMVLNQPPFEQTNPFPVQQQSTFTNGQQPLQQSMFTGPVQPQLGPLNPDFTGAGFGGYTSQSQAQTYPTAPVPIQPQPTGFMGPAAENGYMGLFTTQQQQQVYPFAPGQQQQQQPTATPLSPQTTSSTNPFRRSKTFTGISPQFTGADSASSAPSSNPFHLAKAPSANLAAVPENGDLAQQQRQQQSTNPFANRSVGVLAPSGPALSAPDAVPLLPTNTGSTNPFRKSMV